MVLAQDEARTAGHGEIGTVHMLLGLLGEGYGIPAQVLTERGVTLKEIRRESALEHPVADAAALVSPPFTDKAKKALEQSLRAALAASANEIRTEHLFLGVLRVGDDSATRVLSTLGVDLHGLESEVLARAASEAAAERGEASPEFAYPLPRPVDLPPGTPVPGAGPPGAPPRCPSCGAGLAGRLRYRRTEAEDEDGDGLPVAVVLVHCGACGTGVGVVSDYS